MKNFKKVSFVLGCATLCVSGITAAPTPQKDKKVTPDITIRFVQLPVAMQECPQGQAKTEELKVKQTEIAGKIKGKQQELQTAAADLEKKKNVMNKTAQQELEGKVVSLKGELESLSKSGEYEWNYVMQQATTGLFKEVQESAKELAQKNNYDAIIDSTSGQIVYVADTVDITSDILSMLTQKHEVTLAQATTKDTAKKTVSA